MSSAQMDDRRKSQRVIAIRTASSDLSPMNMIKGIDIIIASLFLVPLLCY